MAKANKKQNIFVLSSSFGVLAIAVLATLYASGLIFSGSGGDESGYRNITFTDAVVACRETTQASYGNRIQTLVTDNHSSRFDAKSYLYKIFMKMDLFDDSGERATLHYVNCFVRSGNGKVRKYEVYEQVEGAASRVSDDTNMFGMPKRKK